ncbi:pilus assembly FimT family protein [Salinibius halmophilus]|uniref:pilus assembly FimT family protein n=1 Tax=Salinibius halmophilus TaxID=1853216 RepID=UPI000E66C446|nr:prepilin-type N-terminal cleavage/methylation domain-containing protein [Salinibius halmophilus]
MQKQSGFTIIELVIVIVLLGILAAVAVPRFVNLTSAAKSSQLESIAGTMHSSLLLIKAQALVRGQAVGNGTINVNGTNIDLLDGYPSVDGSVSFVEINRQVLAWMDLDIVDRDTAFSNPNAAPLFSDKSSSANQIFIFFSSDAARRSVSFGCQIRYQNQGGGNYLIRVLTNEC